MRWFAYLLVAVVLACGASAPAAAAPTPAEAFKPTAFSVAVHGHGRPVIFIPGLACPGSVWDDTVAHLDGIQAHVITISGFAGVPRIDAPIAAQVREQLAHYIRDRRLVKPVLVGHSLGGYLAYWLAASEPALVGPTIVVESGASLGDGSAKANAATGAQVRAMWAEAGDYEYEAQVKDIFGSMAAHKDRLVGFLDQISKSDRRAIGDAIYEQYTTDLRPQLAKVTAPVLVILVEGSLLDKLKAQAEMVPHHQIAVIPHAKHFVMLDEPEAFQKAITGFLASNGAVATVQASPARVASRP